MKNKLLQQKHFYKTVFALFIPLLFCTCKDFSDFTIPEKISVTTDAKYTVSAGECFYDDLRETLGSELIDKLKENVSDSKVYKYIPDQEDDTLQYLIQKELYDVQLDVGEYINKMDLNNIFSDTDDGLNVDKKITLPTINQNKDIGFELEKITNSMDISMKSDSGSSSIKLTNVPEAGSGNSKSLDDFFKSTGNENKMVTKFKYAKHIQFTSDSKLKITVAKTDSLPIGPDYKIDLTAKIKEIKDKDTGKVIFHETKAGPKNVANGGVLELPFNDGQGGKLASEFEVIISGTYSGGNIGTFHEYKLDFDMSNAKLKTIYEIDPQNYNDDPYDDMDMSKYDMPISQEVDIDSMDSIINTAVLGDGALDIKVEKPARWEKVSLDLNEFSMTGVGLNLNKNDFTNTPNTTNYLLDRTMQFEKIDDKKKTLDFTKGSEKKINISGNAKVVLKKGATIDLGEDGKNTTLNGKVIIKINTISKATADFSEFINFEMKEGGKKEKQLPEELIKYVSKIEFGQKKGDKYYKHDKNKNLSNIVGEGVGIKCKVLNTLPSGNDIPLKIKSNLFDIDSTNPKKWKDANGASIPSGLTSAQKENWVSYPVIEFKDPKTGKQYETPPYIDFAIGPESETQTLINLSLGATYTFGISDVEFVFDWDSADMNFASAVDPIQSELDLTEFSLSKITDNLGESYKDITDNLEFTSIPTYFFIQKPSSSLQDIVGNVTLSGSVYMSYTNSESHYKTEYIIGKKNSSEKLEFSDSINWPSISKTDTFTEDLALFNNSKEYDLKNILNERPAGLKLEYDIKLENGKNSTIYKASLDEMKKTDSASIAIDVAIILPMELNFVNGAKIDVLKIADIDNDDLLNRDDVDSMEDFAEYSDSVEYIRLYYNLENKLISGLNADILIDDSHSNESSKKKYTGIEKTVSFSTEDDSENYINFSNEETEKILTNFFMPKIFLKPKEGTIKILRSGIEEEKSFGMTPTLVIQLDSNSPICITDILNK